MEGLGPEGERANRTGLTTDASRTALRRRDVNLAVSHMRPPRRRPVRLSPPERIALGCAIALAWAFMPVYDGVAWLLTFWRPRREQSSPKS